MNEAFHQSLKSLIGRPCCRMQARTAGGLSIGFGKKIFHGNPRVITEFYGEWEIGSYYGSWRYIQNGRILCASEDIFVDVHQMNQRINEIELGDFSSLRQIGNFDFRVESSSGIWVDFLATISDGDEIFHVFCPENVYWEFTADGGWKTGKSDQPWN